MVSVYSIVYGTLAIVVGLVFLCTGDPRLFWAQMALASLVPFQGPKKSRFSGSTPSNATRNDVAPLKIITYRAIKTTGTLIVKFCCRNFVNVFPFPPIGNRQGAPNKFLLFIICQY